MSNIIKIDNMKVIQRKVRWRALNQSMKKIAGIFVSIIGVVMLAGCGASPANNDSDKLAEILSESVVTVPGRPAEVNGIISSMEGNQIIVKNEIGKEILSEEEAAAKKAERQKMTQEERQAIMAQERANTQTEDLSLEIPVGVTILKGTGDGSGNSINAVFEDLKKGVYISIWRDGEKIELIKIKGI